MGRESEGSEYVERESELMKVKVHIKLGIMYKVMLCSNVWGCTGWYGVVQGCTGLYGVVWGCTGL